MPEEGTVDLGGERHTGPTRVRRSWREDREGPAIRRCHPTLPSASGSPHAAFRDGQRLQIGSREDH